MSILFNEQPLVINVELAMVIGLNEAIVLQQIHYWMSKGSGIEHDGVKWIYNTYEQWKEQFPFWSTDTIKRALTTLNTKGLVRVEQLNKSKHDRTNYYTINKLAVAALRPDDSAPIEEGNLHSSTKAECTALTENTAETSSEIKSSRRQQADNCPAQKIADLFNELLTPALPAVVLMNPDRKAKVKARWNENPVHQSLEFWAEYFALIKQSDFLMGRSNGKNGGKPFRATFDWLIAPSNFVKVVEGNYHA